VTPALQNALSASSRNLAAIRQASRGCPTFCSGKNLRTNIHRYIGTEVLRITAAYSSADQLVLLLNERGGALYYSGYELQGHGC